MKYINDVIFIYASVTDSSGTVIPDFSGKILFTVEGDAKLIGENPIVCEAGIAAILLKAGAKLEQIKVTAISDELDLKTSYLVK